MPHIHCRLLLVCALAACTAPDRSSDPDVGRATEDAGSGADAPTGTDAAALADADEGLDAGVEGGTARDAASFVDAGVATDVARPRRDAGAPDAGTCDRIVIAPARDATAALASALAEASRTRIGGVPGNDAAATSQGRVYLPAGEYGLDTIDVPSNVRVEIEPGATLRPLSGTSVVFQLGRGDRRGGGTAVRNVTITAGDGCGGPGTSTSRAGSEIVSSDFRFNDPTVPHASRGERPTVGMTNAPIPFSTDWPVETMWVMDLDPRATGAAEDVTGFELVWAEDVRIERVFSIQNAERYATDDPSTTGTDETNMLVPGVTSRSTVMMFVPLPMGTITDRATARTSRRVHVAWHYNILSPPGQGPNQIRSCIDCTFEHVFSHGGVAVRPETDGVLTSCPQNDCSCAGGETTGPPATDGSLTGFREFALVDGLRASYVEAVHGNATVQFNPHCLSNGTAIVEHVRGTDMFYGVVVGGPRNGAPGEAEGGGAGRFERVTLRDVVAFGGDGAQNRETGGEGGMRGGWRGYVVERSSAAIVRGGASYPVVLAGDACWPSAGPTRLADGDLDEVTGPYTLTHTGCPTSF